MTLKHLIARGRAARDSVGTRLGRVPRTVRGVALAVGIGLGALLPVIMTNVYYQVIAVLALIYVLLGVGMNILVGHTGLVHSGYAAFFGIGAYTVAIFSTKFDQSFWLALPVGMVAAALLAFLIGVPAIRVSGLYFVLVTLGFGELFRLTISNLDYTGGVNGLYGIQRPEVGSVQLASPEELYWLSFGFVVISFFLAYRLAKSRIGRAWNYVREDEIAAQVLGINPIWGKLQAAMLAGSWAGIAGALFAVRQTAVSPGSFTFNDSFLVILIVSVGGLRSLPGTVLGTIAIIVVPELLRPLLKYRSLAFGAIIVLMMLFRPEGLWPGKGRRRYEAVANRVARRLEGGS